MRSAGLRAKVPVKCMRTLVCDFDPLLDRCDDHENSVCLLLWAGPTTWQVAYTASIASIIGVDLRRLDGP